jgi:hypothetical protein
MPGDHTGTLIRNLQRRVKDSDAAAKAVQGYQTGHPRVESVEIAAQRPRAVD